MLPVLPSVPLASLMVGFLSLATVFLAFDPYSIRERSITAILSVLNGLIKCELNKCKGSNAT